MAYREFYKRQDIVLKDYSALERGLTNMFKGIQAEIDRKKDLNRQVDYALEKGGSESDERWKLKHTAKVVSDSQKLEKSTNWLGKTRKDAGEVPSKLQIQQDMEEGQMAALKIKHQQEKFNELRGRIKALPDYWDKEQHEKDLGAAYVGDGSDETWRTRDNNIQDVEKNIGGGKYFKLEKYTKDWVDTFGKKIKETQIEGSVTKKSGYISSPFLKDDGSYGIPDEVATNYFSNPAVKESLEMRVQNEIAIEAEAIKKAADSGDERVSKFKPLTDADIMLYLKDNPSENIINNKPFNERVRDKGVRTLNDAVSTHLKNSVEYKDDYRQGPVKSKHDFEYSIWDDGDPGFMLLKPGGEEIKYMRNGKLVTVKGASINSATGDLEIRGTSFTNVKNAAQLNSIEGNILRKLAGVSLETDDESVKKAEEYKAQLDAIQDVRKKISSGESYETLGGTLASVGIGNVGEEFKFKATKDDITWLKSITKGAKGEGGLDLNNQSHWDDNMRNTHKKAKVEWDAFQSQKQQAEESFQKKAEKLKAQVDRKAVQEDVKLKNAYTVNGNNYSIEELKNLGYTEEQIKEAVKIGTIQ